MDIHKNARLTPKGQVVRQVLSGQTPKAAALAVGVCPRNGFPGGLSGICVRGRFRHHA